MRVSMSWIWKALQCVATSHWSNGFWSMRSIERFPSKQMYLYFSLVERKEAEFYHNIDGRCYLVWLKWLIFIAFSGQLMVSLIMNFGENFLGRHPVDGRNKGAHNSIMLVKDKNVRYFLIPEKCKQWQWCDIWSNEKYLILSWVAYLDCEMHQMGGIFCSLIRDSLRYQSCTFF